MNVGCTPARAGVPSHTVGSLTQIMKGKQSQERYLPPWPGCPQRLHRRFLARGHQRPPTLLTQRPQNVFTQPHEMLGHPRKSVTCVTDGLENLSIGAKRTKLGPREQMCPDNALVANSFPLANLR